MNNIEMYEMLDGMLDSDSDTELYGLVKSDENNDCVKNNINYVTDILKHILYRVYYITAAVFIFIVLAMFILILLLLPFNLGLIGWSQLLVKNVAVNYSDKNSTVVKYKQKKYPLIILDEPTNSLFPLSNTNITGKLMYMQEFDKGNTLYAYLMSDDNVYYVNNRCVHRWKGYKCNVYDERPDDHIKYTKYGCVHLRKTYYECGEITTSYSLYWMNEIVVNFLNILECIGRVLFAGWCYLLFALICVGGILLAGCVIILVAMIIAMLFYLICQLFHLALFGEKYNYNIYGFSNG